MRQISGRFIYFFQFCDVATLVVIIELAKFGYKSQRKVENFKNPTYYILATSWNLFSKFGQFQNFFPGNMANLAHVFIQTNLLYESHWNFI